MPAPISAEQEAEFIAIWNRFQSPLKVSQHSGLTLRQVYVRRAKFAEKGNFLATEQTTARVTPYAAPRVKWERSREIEVPDGTVVIFADPHWYPDQDDIGLDALCSVIRDIKPKAVLCGGDALDGTQIGRWEPTRGWHAPPDLVEQLDAMVESMNRINTAAGKHTPTFMILGNHDARFSRYIAEHAPHLEHLPGTRLEDYIPAWPLSWTVEINGNTVLRHRPLKSGANAPYQSTLHSGWHSLNGHNRITDHRIEVTLYNLPAGLDGDLDGVIEPLMAHDLEQRLVAAGA